MPRSARSDTSDADLDADGMAEREYELQRLQRQYRLMDGDKKAYCQESQELIERQKKEIKKLEREREETLTNLRLQESRSNQSKDDVASEKLTGLADEKSSLQKDCDNEKKKQEELQAENREWEAKINKQHKNMGGVNMSKQHSHQQQKKMGKMENQVQQSQTKFNDALVENRDLREEIENLRVQRVRFEELYDKLYREREELKREIGETIDQSTQAYDARDEAQAKMILLKEKSDKDVAQHQAEMKELVRIIDHDRKLKEFMTTKGKERQEDPMLVKWRDEKEQRELERKKGEQVDTVESYKAAFERIRQITGEDDIDLLVTHFIEVEDRNFALFNFVNEQNNEIEMLQEQIEEIQNDIENFKAHGIELEVQRKSILKKLEEKQTESSSEADDYDEKYTGVMKILDQLQAGIDSLFGKINCDRSTIDDMLGAHTGVTEQNMIQYLGIIEQQTNRLLLIQAYSHKQKDYDEYRTKQPSLLGEGPQQPAPPPHIQAPAVGDEYESEASESDDDNRPMTRNELKDRVMKTVKKREIAARKEGFRYDLTGARDTQKKQSNKGKGGRH